MKNFRLTKDLDAAFAPLREAKENWDSYGGNPLDPECERRARDIVATLAEVPSIALHGDGSGGVYLAWGGNDGIEIEVLPGGYVAAYIDDTDLYPEPAELKVECPRNECAYSFVGADRAQELIDHWTACHGGAS